MSLFGMSVGSHNGGDVGGLAGVDAHSAALVNAAGADGETWRTYLSTQEDGKRGLSARDRIGSGPWYNTKGVLIARDVDQLHISPNIFKSTALEETGALIKGRGNVPNKHDILAATMADGTAHFPREDAGGTCSNWTSSAEGSVTISHYDRHGGGKVSWNAAHNARGRAQEDLTKIGGGGLYMCFAAD